MHNRERIKNTALITDLLNTYLTNQARERQRYEAAARPKTYAAGGNIIQINPEGEVEVLYKEKEKDYKNILNQYIELLGDDPKAANAKNAISGDETVGEEVHDFFKNYLTDEPKTYTVGGNIIQTNPEGELEVVYGGEKTWKKIDNFYDHDYNHNTSSLTKNVVQQFGYREAVISYNKNIEEAKETGDEEMLAVQVGRLAEFDESYYGRRYIQFLNRGNSDEKSAKMIWNKMIKNGKTEEEANALVGTLVRTVSQMRDQ